MKTILYLFVSLLLIVNASAEVGVKMLTAEQGARAIGMGGAYTSISADPISAAYNPAAVRGVTKLSGSFGYNSYWENSRIESGYIAFEKRAVTISAGVQFAAIDNMQGRLIADDDFFEFDAHDMNLKVGAAFELEPNYYLGFAVGWINEKIEHYSDFAFNFDLGLLIQAYPDLYIGLAVLNYGSTIQLGEEPYDLPTTYRGGVSYTRYNVTGAIDVVRLDGDIYTHIGSEYSYKKMLFLRGGYRIGYDTKDISAGAGFTKKNFRIDYAFLPFSGSLGSAHTFNLTFRL
jgi:hypothetical protein